MRGQTICLVIMIVVKALLKERKQLHNLEMAVRNKDVQCDYL